MFDVMKLKAVLVAYKQNFVSKQWGDEKYKWEAVKWFQDNWDVNASDFAEMLTRSLDKTFNLLASNNNFPKGMIIGFAKAAPEEVRAMFIALFDESKDVFERMVAFKTHSSVLLEKYGNGAAQHYQYENAISTYLWLRFPDKYYIYKFGEVKTVASELGAGYRFKKGAYADNIRNFLTLYDEISVALKEDTELVNLFQSQLTDSCYPDPELKTLTIDVGFYISRYYSQKDTVVQEEAEWFPSTYSPGITVDEWIKLLNDSEVFTTASLEIMKRMKDYGGQATCKQLSVKYGQSSNFYNAGSSTLAKRIADKTGCPLLEVNTENSKWWPILYVGRYATKEEQGSYIWKLREELSEALEKVDLSDIELYVAAAPGEQDRGYWWLNANPKIWSFADIAVGEVQSYTLYNENGNKRRIFQNFLAAKAGDMIIGYESNPVKQIVAIGRVSAEQDGEKLFFEKVEGLTSPIDYATLKGCPELERMEYFQNPQGSLFKLTRGEYDFILDVIREENPVAQEASIDAYTKSDFLDEVYMTEKRYENLVAVLRNKKNIILQGAPGVGKTFAARRLAWSMMGEKDDSRIEFVQFHQNYSYEDFMMGYKPVEDGFKLKYGIFYRFCQKAANQPDKEFFFIIDEINRGNMPYSMHRLFRLKEYKPGALVLGTKQQKTAEQSLYDRGERPDALIDWPVDALDYELVDIFNWQEEAAGMISQMEFVRRVDVQTETIERYVRDGLLVPDLVVPMSEHRTFKYFKEETLQKYAQQYGWTLIDDSNRKDLFLDMVRQMDMSYSYKPVLLKAVLLFADDKGRVKLSDIVTYFREFYEARRAAGMVVEKANSIYAKGGYTDAQAQRNILSNPFKRFEDMQMLHHTKTLGVIQVDESVWKKLTREEKQEIERICDEKLESYFQRLK